MGSDLILNAGSGSCCQLLYAEDEGAFQNMEYGDNYGKDEDA